jgi:ATP-dependent Clp protease ATP-binding subunit ClpC
VAVEHNFNTLRARKARFNRKLGDVLKITCFSLLAIFVIGGGYWLYLGNLNAYYIILAAVWPMMFLLWQARDLKHLKPKGDDIAGLLDGDILGGLPTNPTPQDIAKSIDGTIGGKFFAARLGIPSAQIAQYVSSEVTDSEAIWVETRQIHNNLKDKGKTITAATVFAALIRVSPNIRQILPDLKLDENDVISGAEWFAHLNKIFERGNAPKLTGGVARDWSFGYIPTLKRFGSNLSEKYAYTKGVNVQLESHEDLVNQMVQTFSTGGRQNVTLIGPIGSGKTTVVEAFAERLMDGETKVPKSLQYRQVISLDATSLISAAPGRGELEQLVTIVMNEAYSAKNIILCLDNAQLFFEEGTGSVDITNVLQPILEGGALRLILAMEEQKFLEISQRNAALTAAMNRLQVQPPNEAETMRIVEDNSLLIESEKRVVFMYQALREAYRLAERYVQDVAQPRRTIQVLEAAAGVAKGGLVSADVVRSSMESTLGVKIGVTDSAEEKQQLLNLEDLIHERMINQVAAVKAVSEALRRARAGVRNENRPIGTFLFLGPTGVGKTELAKTLSEVYFSGEGNMVRVDMNEYVRAEDVSRLIADAVSDPNSLVAQITKNPFSVVLLDEIEKAHTNVISTLLQVLDEGILRDINNREISFRDAILIATSNAGSNRIRQYIEAGYDVEQFEEQFKNELIDSRQFTPEFLNRFDDIVVFRPLTKEELLEVVGLQLKSVNKTLSTQKVSVNVAEDAKTALVDAGYDPRLGARPMRRVVQRTVENIVSQKLLSGELQPGQTLEISLPDIQATGELDKNEK